MAKNKEKKEKRKKIVKAVFSKERILTENSDDEDIIYPPIYQQWCCHLGEC